MYSKGLNTVSVATTHVLSEAAVVSSAASVASASAASVASASVASVAASVASSVAGASAVSSAVLPQPTNIPAVKAVHNNNAIDFFIISLLLLSTEIAAQSAIFFLFCEL